MKLLFTEQALISFEESLSFISNDVSHEKLLEIRDKIIEAANKLLTNPFIGQKEIYLDHLGLNHRRLIVGHYKIIYRVTKQYIFITDIFDTRQDPNKMKE